MAEPASEAVARGRPWWLELGSVVPRSLALLAREARPDGDGGRPHLRASPVTLATVALDELAMSVAFLANRGGTEPPAATSAAAAVECLAAAGVLADPLLAHPAPPVPAETRLTVRRRQGRTFEHLSFPSSYSPPAGYPCPPDWEACEPNRTVHAYLLRDGAAPKPWLLVLHGHRMGEPWDLLLLGSRRLQRELGINVAHVVLPRHGPRGRGSGSVFPGVDPVVNFLGMAQAISDARSVVGWLRAAGADAIAVYGISLGAHAAALLAAVEPGLAGVVVGVPTADFTTMLETTIRAHWGDDVLAAAHVGDEASRTLNRLVSPLAFAPLVPRHHRFIYAAVGDRIVTPDQAVALWRHWDEPEILWLQGSHIANPVARARRFVEASLATCGLAATAA